MLVTLERRDEIERLAEPLSDAMLSAIGVAGGLVDWDTMILEGSAKGPCDKGLAPETMVEGSKADGPNDA